MQKPCVIIFDWDGTIVDTVFLSNKVRNELFKSFSLPEESIEETKKNGNGTVFNLKDGFFRSNYEKVIEIMDSVYEENWKKMISLKPEIFKTISFIKSLGIKIGIVSNKRHYNLLAEVQHFNLVNEFDTIIGSGITSKDKPAPDPIFLALQSIQNNSPIINISKSEYLLRKNTIEPVKIDDIETFKNVWMVGDSSYDWESAISSGCLPFALWEKNISSNIEFNFINSNEMIEFKTYSHSENDVIFCEEIMDLVKLLKQLF